MIRHLIALAAALLCASSLTLAAVPEAGQALGSTIVAKQAAPQMPSRVLGGTPTAQESFRASGVAPVDVARLPAPEKASAPTVDSQGRLRIGSVRSLEKAAAIPEWTSIPEGFVSTLRATSEGAEGLRVRLEVGRRAAPIEIRVMGSGERVESMIADPARGTEIWTPWTDGATQVIELFSPTGAPLPAVSVTAVLHFDASPLEKATAGSCTIPASCSVGTAELDNAIAERVKSSARITFIEGTSGFLCSATLMNTDKFPVGYVLTANHCVSSVASANTVITFWFYQPTSCFDVSVKPGMVQLNNGTTITFTNYNADSTLLRMRDTPPVGAVYAGWNAERMSHDEPIVSISHPRGDTTRVATGNITREYRINERAQDEYGVKFQSGIIEGGSSGSGLYTLGLDGSLYLRGVLTGTTVRNGSGMSCTNLDEEALYGRLDIFYPQILPYITGDGPAADDAPNRVIDISGLIPEIALDGRTVTLDRRFEVEGDVDVFRFTLGTRATVTLGTLGSLDTIGTLMDGNGTAITANDDVASGNLNFGITRTLDAGTYFVMVAPWEPDGTGAYRFQMSAAAPATPVVPAASTVNYTNLWWGMEPGWGISIAHQGDIVFAILHTFDMTGAARWFFMSNGNKQPDGSFTGSLYTSSGQWFGTPGWSPNTVSPVGTMTLSFPTPTTGNLTYSLNGITVTKTITPQVFVLPATKCTMTEGDRVESANYQDLWWNPAESGWGLSIAHQGNILFVVMHVYDTSGKAQWLTVSRGDLVGTRTYSGLLYRSVGPVFNTVPWIPSTNSQVGDMTLTFTDGENGTITYTADGVRVQKPIRRQVYSNPKPLCSPDS